VHFLVWFPRLQFGNLIVTLCIFTLITRNAVGTNPLCYWPSSWQRDGFVARNKQQLQEQWMTVSIVGGEQPAAYWLNQTLRAKSSRSFLLAHPIKESKGIRHYPKLHESTRTSSLFKVYSNIRPKISSTPRFFKRSFSSILQNKFLYFSFLPLSCHELFAWSPWQTWVKSYNFEWDGIINDYVGSRRRQSQ
jgi:hypothetical protein